jgi:hypothetical protein
VGIHQTRVRLFVASSTHSTRSMATILSNPGSQVKTEPYRALGDKQGRAPCLLRGLRRSTRNGAAFAIPDTNPLRVAQCNAQDLRRLRVLNPSNQSRALWCATCIDSHRIA